MVLSKTSTAPVAAAPPQVQPAPSCCHFVSPPQDPWKHQFKLKSLEVSRMTAQREAYIDWLIDLTCFSRSAASLCTRWKLFKACTKLFKNRKLEKSQTHLCEFILQPLPLKLCSTIQYLGNIQHCFRTYSASNKLSQPVHLQVVSIVLRCLWQVDQCSVATASTGPSTPHPGSQKCIVP